MSHTPGPWVLSDCEEDEYGLPYYIIGPTDAGGSTFVEEQICQVWCPEHDLEANARLILAAPDLLDAIKLVLPLAKGYRPDGQTETARKTCDSWISVAEEIVAKAEGKS